VFSISCNGIRQAIEQEGFLIIRRGAAAILLMCAGAVLSGCALPFAGPLLFTDILTGASIITTVATGKGATEIALDVLTGEDCRLLEGALREDRDICEQPGSAATEEDFKGVVAWLEEVDPASPVPSDADTPHIMVADIGLPSAAPTQPVAQFANSLAAPAIETTQPRVVALASISELPNDWIILASLQTGSESTELGAIAPASGTPDLIRVKSDSSQLPFLHSAGSPEADPANWAFEKINPGTPDVAEQALTMPPSPAQGPVAAPGLRDVLNEMYVRSNFEPSLDVALLLPAPVKPLLLALLPPAPAKPRLQAFLPHPHKPTLQAGLPDDSKQAHAEFNMPQPTPI